MMQVENVLMKPGKTNTKNPTRKGRGIGSGKGKTAGRGHKGQLARSGKAKSPFRATSDTPLQRHLPKRGFKALNPKSSMQMSISEFLQMSCSISEYIKNNNADLSIKTIIAIDRAFFGVKRIKVFLSGFVDVQDSQKFKGIKIGAGFFFTKSCKDIVVNLGFEF